MFVVATVCVFPVRECMRVAVRVCGGGARVLQYSVYRKMCGVPPKCGKRWKGARLCVGSGVPSACGGVSTCVYNQQQNDACYTVMAWWRREQWLYPRISWAGPRCLLPQANATAQAMCACVLGWPLAWWAFALRAVSRLRMLGL